MRVKADGNRRHKLNKSIKKFSPDTYFKVLYYLLLVIQHNLFYNKGLC